MFFSKKNKILKTFNFKTDQQGIMNRFLREQDNWKEHLEKTKEFILESCKNTNRKNVVVLGSGWWLDVPVEELCSIFEKVYLVDIVHAPQIKHKATKYPKVELITKDITGQASEIIFNIINNYRKNKEKTPIEVLNLNTNNFSLPSELRDSYFVSVNILNQLDILLLDELKKQDIYSEEELETLRKKIQDAHLEALPKGQSCLITDFTEISIDVKSKEISNEKQLIFTELPKKSTKSWLWKFDNHKTYHADCNTHFLVKAYEI